MRNGKMKKELFVKVLSQLETPPKSMSAETDKLARNAYFVIT